MNNTAKVHKDAALIAAHIQNGDLVHAKSLFQTCIKDLAHFEAAALRDLIHEKVDVLANTRGEPNRINNGY